MFLIHSNKINKDFKLAEKDIEPLPKTMNL